MILIAAPLSVQTDIWSGGERSVDLLGRHGIFC